jgi:hypothetical protein
LTTNRVRTVFEGHWIVGEDKDETRSTIEGNGDTNPAMALFV